MTIAIHAATVPLRLLRPPDEKKAAEPDCVPVVMPPQKGLPPIAGLKNVVDLIDQRMDDPRKAGVTFDIVAEAFEGSITRADDALGKLRRDLASAQTAVDDLGSLNAVLQNSLAEHPAQSGTIDLSDTMVSLSKDSPMRQAGHASGTASVGEFLDYYRNAHPELNLRELPKTYAELKALAGTVDNAIKMTLEFRTQEVNTAMQQAIQNRNALLELQSVMYRAISDAMKKFISAT